MHFALRCIALSFYFFFLGCSGNLSLGSVEDEGDITNRGIEVREREKTRMMPWIGWSLDETGSRMSKRGWMTLH